MKKLESKYPLGQLLIELFTWSGLNLPQFVQSIGYRKVNKGIRAFQEFLATGYGPHLFFKRLHTSPLAPSNAAMKMVMQQHFEQMSQELHIKYGLVAEDYKESFQPFLHAAPSLREVESLSFFAQSGDFSEYTMILQQKIATLPLDVQYQIVGKKIRHNYRATGGKIEFLGPTRYYLYYHSWNEPPMTFSVEGDPIGIADNATIPRERMHKVSRHFDNDLLTLLLHTREDQPLH